MNLKKINDVLMREFFPKYEIINVKDSYLIGRKFRKGRKDFYSATATGEEIFNYIKIHTNYQSTSNILDVGCGDGLLPNALVRHKHRGDYVGVEIIRTYVTELTKLYKHAPNYEFIYKNIYHSYYSYYNDGISPLHTYGILKLLRKRFTAFYHEDAISKVKRKKLIIPFVDKLSLKAKKQKQIQKDNSLIDPLEFSLEELQPKDLIVFNSVFSHLKLVEIKHYLNECKKLMDRGSEIYATFFIFDEFYNEDIADEAHKIRQVYDEGWTSQPNNPEFTVIFKKETIEQLAKDLELKVIKYVPGYWKMNRTSMDSHHQDLLVLKKANR